MPAARFLHIRDRLWSDITAGTFGGQLPPEPELALRYQVSRMTLRRAIALLASEGILAAHQGRGTFINREGRPAGRTGTVAIALVDEVLEGSADPYFGIMVSAIAGRLAGHDLALRMIKASDPLLTAAPRSSDVGGVIAMAFDRDQVWHLSATPLPLVLLDSAPLPERTCVLSENRRGVMLALDHLTGLGHRHIAHIAGAAATVAGQERLMAWRSRMAGLGLAAGECPDGGFTAEGGEAAMNQLLDLPRAPTAVLCANDRMALGAMRAIRVRGLRVPRDVSVIGFDDIEASALSDPPLTTIAVPRTDLANAACDALMAEMGGGAAGATIRLGVTLTLRGSTAPPPA